jgi:hypothetical protein
MGQRGIVFGGYKAVGAPAPAHDFLDNRIFMLRLPEIPIVPV